MAKFSSGRLVATQGAIRVFTPDVLNEHLQRHMSGDWGDLCDADKEQNRIALKFGDRLMSCYDIGTDRLWIITEWDRSVTTMLLPDEY